MYVQEFNRQYTQILYIIIKVNRKEDEEAKEERRKEEKREKNRSSESEIEL